MPNEGVSRSPEDLASRTFEPTKSLRRYIYRCNPLWNRGILLRYLLSSGVQSTYNSVVDVGAVVFREMLVGSQLLHLASCTSYLVAYILQPGVGDNEKVSNRCLYMDVVKAVDLTRMRESRL